MVTCSVASKELKYFKCKWAFTVTELLTNKRRNKETSQKAPFYERALKLEGYLQYTNPFYCYLSLKQLIYTAIVDREKGTNVQSRFFILSFKIPFQIKSIKTCSFPCLDAKL